MKLKTHLFLTALILTSMTSWAQNADTKFLMSPKGIAMVEITLDDGKTKDDIKRDEKSQPATKLTGTMVVKNANGSTYDDSELYNGKIQIKGRGNTSWGNPKKPYSIDLVKEEVNKKGETELKDNPFAILGMPEDEEWVLIASWVDRTAMRHALAYHLAGMMDGMRWAPRTRFVEVSINGEYLGLYLFAEKIKRGKNRVDIAKLDDKNGDYTGGYLIESSPEDRVDDNERQAFFRTEKYGYQLLFKYPKPKNVKPEMVSWIRNYLNEFEDRLEARDHSEDTGWRKYADPEGFYDWIILHDLSKGVDNLMHASVFFEKDKGNSKLRMSAPWDFDLSFGNVDNSGDPKYEDQMWLRKVHWFGKMWEDQAFARAISDRLEQLLPTIAQLAPIIEANYQQLHNSGAYARDNERWPQILNDFRDAEGRDRPHNHRAHARWLTEWIESRAAWMHTHYAPTEEENCNRLKNTRAVLRVYSPDKFENGENVWLRTTRGFAAYLWDGKTRSDSPAYYVNDDKEHYVQYIDEHGCTSLPSNPIKRGNTYKESFGTSQLQTTAIKDISAGNATDAIAFLYSSSGKSLRISCAAAKNMNMTVRVCSLSGVTINTLTIPVYQGLGVYNADISGIATGAYIVECKAGSDIKTGKIIIK